MALFLLRRSFINNAGITSIRPPSFAAGNVRIRSRSLLLLRNCSTAPPTDAAASIGVTKLYALGESWTGAPGIGLEDSASPVPVAFPPAPPRSPDVGAGGAPEWNVRVLSASEGLSHSAHLVRYSPRTGRGATTPPITNRQERFVIKIAITKTAVRSILR
mmetsp:Transcript_42385/g.99493  ORF Transcript_42385/g.99493 Transcript_42385/m.99493 type:complete len:160 (-) Transcript_42385:2520-2999(-)